MIHYGNIVRRCENTSTPTYKDEVQHKCK